MPPRRPPWSATALLLLAALLTAAGAGAHPAPSLRPYRWRRLPTGRIRPGGWLERQARLQAGALTKHLPLFWPEVANTSWLGGGADNDGGIHESTPYWLNGAVPLAYQLGDAELIEVVEHYIQGILARQAADGWLGPDTDPSDYWSRYPVLLALVQYHEAHPKGSQARQRTQEAALAFFESVAVRLNKTRKMVSWSGARAHDAIWAMHYFVDALEAGEEARAARLLRLAEAFHRLGFDWNGQWFNNTGAFPREPAVKLGMFTHGVNNAQALKHGAVWARQSADAAASVAQSRLAWEALQRYHGQPHGAFAADEHLAGTMPSRGTELCLVVEAMWSLSLMAQASLEDGAAAEALDALEQLAVNALPGSLSDDLWSHPYLQFANSFQARPGTQDHAWANDGPDAAMYGLAPNYECCTANFHQGYPKLIASLFFEVPSERTLVSALWMPSSLNTSSDVGGGATVELRTEYPFGLSAEYMILNPQAMKLKIRLPAFLREVAGPGRGLDTVRVWVEGRECAVELADGFLSYEIPAWPLPEPRAAVRVEWAAGLRVQRWPAGAGQGASLFAGPLLLTPDLQEQRVAKRRYAFEAADWDTTAGHGWGYALPPAGIGTLGAVQRRTPGDLPFAHSAARCPVVASAVLMRLCGDEWPSAHNAPGPVPPPAPLKGSLENVTLVPYGCSALHVAALPELAVAGEGGQRLLFS